MWHSTFDPHTEVPFVPEAELKTAKQSKTISVAQVLENFGGRAQVASEALQSTKESDKVETPEDKEKQAQLLEMSKKTGISVETLKQIKAAESSQRENRKAQAQMIEAQMGKQQS
jgi:hypothetical protein